MWAAAFARRSAASVSKAAPGARSIATGASPARAAMATTLRGAMATARPSILQTTRSAHMTTAAAPRWMTPYASAAPSVAAVWTSALRADQRELFQRRGYASGASSQAAAGGAAPSPSALESDTDDDKPKRVKDEKTTVQKALTLAQLRLEREQEEARAERRNIAVKDDHAGGSLWQRFKGAMHEYWVGSKLLYLETKVSLRLVTKVIRGQELSRRERKQLLRTTSDMFRLVPFIIIVIVPFAEFALPVLLRFFPDMLPSTFEGNFAKVEKKKQLLKARLEVAKFLQDAVEQMPVDTRKHAEKTRFLELSKKVRESGQSLSNDEILEFAALFEDEFTLDNLSSPQLHSLCRYMNISTIGTDPFLRFQLRNRFKQIREDDQLIKRDGVDSLTVLELQQACSQRGIPTLGVATSRLRSNLKQWIELALVKEIPPSLLIMSHAMTMPTVQALQSVIRQLPEEVVKEVELDIMDATGRTSNEKRLEEVKLQEKLISQENLESKRNEKESKEREAELLQRAREGSVDLAKTRALAAAGNPEAAEQLRSQIQAIKREVSLTEEQLIELGEALAILAAPSAVQKERSELETLKTDRKEFRENIQSLKAATSEQVSESRPSKMLGKRVDSLITTIEAELKKVETDVGSKLNIIYPDRDGEISLNELEKALSAIRSRPKDPKQLAQLVKSLDLNQDGRVSIEELKRWAAVADNAEGVPHSAPAMADKKAETK